MIEQDRIAFEKWAKDHEYAIDDYIYALEIWNAATAEAKADSERKTGEMVRAISLAADAREAKLEGEVAELKEVIAISADGFEQLQSSNNDLREALQIAYKWMPASIHVDGFENDMQTILKALSATPAESLQAFENEVIERCAKVCDEVKLWRTAIDIRALKGKV